MAEEITLQELKEMTSEFTPHNPHGLIMAKRIDKLLMAALPELIYEELKSIRKNDDDNKESDELQEYLQKDYHEEYKSQSPLMKQLNEIIITLN